MRIIHQETSSQISLGSVVLSSPPQRRMVLFTGSTQSRLLSFPPLLYRILFVEISAFEFDFHSLYVAATDTDEPKPETRLRGPILPHISPDDLGVCLGESPSLDLPSASVQELIQKTIREFWSSKFNPGDWLSTEHPTLARWEFKTRSDPTWKLPLVELEIADLYSKWIKE